MKRPKIQVPPLPNHVNSPSLRSENNLSSHEEGAVAIANLFRDLGASAMASQIICKGFRNAEELKREAENGIERVEGLLKEIEREVEKL